MRPKIPENLPKRKGAIKGNKGRFGLKNAVTTKKAAIKLASALPRTSKTFSV
jgi:hypothetical protein